MKKVFEKYGVLKCIGSILDILGIILVVIAMPLANESRNNFKTNRYFDDNHWYFCSFL